MPGPAPLVSRQEVFDAAQDFYDSGIWASAKRIREQLGKSSISTIHEILLEWREGKSRDALMLPDVDLSPELIAAIKKFLKAYAGSAVARIRQENVKLEHECDSMANEARAFQMEIERMQGEVDDAKEGRIYSEGRANVLESSLSEERKRVATLNEKLLESERKLDQAETKLGDAQRLNEDQQKILSSVQAQLDIERAETRSLKSEIEQMKLLLKDVQCGDGK